MRWPERVYLASVPHRFVYCPIPKVACSSLKRWLLVLHEGPAAAEIENEHGYSRARYSLGALDRRRARTLLDNQSVLKFAFVRNPWARLVSAYLNKFLPLVLPAREILVDLARRERWPRLARLVPPWLLPSRLKRRAAAEMAGSPLAQSLTFRRFVGYLSATPAAQLEDHFRPQSLFLGPRRFDFLGRFETLDADFAAVCERLGIPADSARLESHNCTRYADGKEAECLADAPLVELRSRSASPGYRAFYTPELAELVGQVYREDAQRFGYEWA